MPPPNERVGNICVYLVSCLLLIAIIGGGVFLVLYITLPESDATAWFPIAGMVLVGTPWMFWFMTCLYRTVSMRITAHGGGGGADRAPGGAAAVAPAAAGMSAVATAVHEDSEAVSPGAAARRVHFGAATTLGASQENPGSGGRGDGSGCSSEKPDAEPDCSSYTSHESELPLFAKS